MADLNKDYPGLFSRAEYHLRIDGVPKDNSPGFELLKKGIVIAKIFGKLPEEIFLEKLYEGGTIIPMNKELKKDRDRAVQWMIEAIEVADIIPLEHEDDVEGILYSYIREVANRL